MHLLSGVQMIDQFCPVFELLGAEATDVATESRQLILKWVDGLKRDIHRSATARSGRTATVSSEKETYSIRRA